MILTRRGQTVGLVFLLVLGLGCRKSFGQEMHGFSEAKLAAPRAMLPAVQFSGLEGGQQTLAGHGGKMAVLNFWATWCPPCVAELPALDRLAAQEPQLAVIAVSNDRGGAAVVKPFLKAHGISHVQVWLDPKGEAARALNVAGLPTTLVLDAKGQLCATLEGPSEWDKQAEAIKKSCGE